MPGSGTRPARPGATFGDCWNGGINAIDWSEVLALSLRVAAIAAVASLVPAIPTAWLLARCRFPGRTLLEALVHAPLVLPPVVVGYFFCCCSAPASC